MLEPERLTEVFRKAGLRWTPQRRAVAEVLWGATTHPSAEDVFQQVRQRHAAMSRATVYNTMEALAAIGQIETLRGVTGTRRFDPNTAPHHHAICRVCGRIEDVPTLVRLGNGSTMDLILPGFRAERCRIEIEGVCASCDGGSPSAAD